MRKVLSFPLGVNTPLFRDNPPVKIWPQFSTDSGDVFNQYFIETINHNGTHMDGARHFNPVGKRLVELPIDSFVFEKSVLIDLDKDKDELIGASDLEQYANEFSDADLLIIRTGFGKYRFTDPQTYGNNNPGFAPSAATYLIDNFPKLRAIGMDFPSAAAANHLDDGILFHQLILGKDRDDGRFILIIEDMNLDQDLSDISCVYGLPLLIEGVDSGPCTILAECK